MEKQVNVVIINSLSCNKQRVVDIEKICRTCLTDEGDMRSLFQVYEYENSDEVIQLNKLLNYCCSLEVEPDDSLPSLICEKCADQAKASCNFKKQCVQSENALKQIIQHTVKQEEPICLHEDNNSATEEILSNYDAHCSSKTNTNHQISTPDGKEHKADIKLGVNGIHLWNDCDKLFLSNSDQTKPNFKKYVPKHEVSLLLEDNRSNSSSAVEVKCDKESDHVENHTLLNNHNLEDLKNDSEEKEPSITKHRCEVCNREFSLKTNLKAHMKKHSKRVIRRPYMCHHCGEGFTLPSSLEVHIRIKHTKERIFKCPKCTKTYTEIRDLNRHLKVHSEDYRCPVCGKVFAFKQSLRTHVRAHDRKEIFTCKECSQQFKDNKLLERHMKITHSGEIHECVICNKTFSHITKLRTHMKSHNTDSEKRLQCKFCPKKFNFVHHLNNHERTHTGIRPYLCNKCGRGFTQSHYLTVHLRLHEDVQPFPCSFCNKTFAQSQRLARHILTHTGEKPFMCNQCGKRFSANATLKRHLELHDNSINGRLSATRKMRIKKEPSNLTCKVCVKTFPDTSALGVHMRTHTCQYICGICNRGYALASTLESHLKSHSAGDRNHVCQICGQSYKRPEHLKSHFRRAHSTERPHTCTICKRAFCQSGELTIHMRRHTGEKPYVCVYCNKGFPASTALTIHIRTHTGEKPYKCDICRRGFSTSSSLAGHMNTHTTKQEEFNPQTAMVCTESSYTVQDNLPQLQMPQIICINENGTSNVIANMSSENLKNSQISGALNTDNMSCKGENQKHVILTIEPEARQCIVSQPQVIRSDAASTHDVSLGRHTESQNIKIIAPSLDLNPGGNDVSMYQAGIVTETIQISPIVQAINKPLSETSIIVEAMEITQM